MSCSGNLFWHVTCASKQQTLMGTERPLHVPPCRPMVEFFALPAATQIRSVPRRSCFLRATRTMTFGSCMCPKRCCHVTSRIDSLGLSSFGACQSDSRSESCMSQVCRLNRRDRLSAICLAGVAFHGGREGQPSKCAVLGRDVSFRQFDRCPNDFSITPAVPLCLRIIYCTGEIRSESLSIPNTELTRSGFWLLFFMAFCCMDAAPFLHLGNGHAAAVA